MAELSSKDREKLNEIVINSQINPFVSSSYENESELNRFVGREKEVELFKSILQASFDSKKAKAVRLSGPGGVGKTTLFCHIKKLLEDSSIQDDPSKRTFDISDTIILPAYFQRPVADFNFKNIWEPLMESLIATFESKTESGINLPFYVGAKIVLQMIEFNPEILKIIYKNKEANNKRDINSVIKALNRFNEDDVKNLQEFYMDNAPEFREFVDKKFPQKQNPLSRNENSIIKELFRCFNERDSYYEDVNSGSIFEDDDQVINYLNSLVRLIMLFTGKRVLFFIGIDEFADDDKKSDTKKDFDAMGRSLLRMRNRSDSIFFTLISTDGDWANFDKSLYEKDLRSQLSSFWQIINLQNLSEKEVVDLFYKRMDHLFWRHYDGDRDLRFPAYPYNENVFKFLYKYLDKDLRETILLLKEQEWPSYKRTGKIPILETEMDCLKHFVFEKQSTPLPFMRFTITIKKFNKFYIQHENKSNKTRSNKVSI